MKNRVKGIFFMTCSSLTCSGLTIAQKLLLSNSKIHPFEMAYWYGIALTILVILTFKYLKLDFLSVPKTFNGDNSIRWTLLIRGTVGVCANIAYNISMTMISMSKASVLFWTNPIVIALLGKFLLKEKLTYFDWAACFMAFCGILLIQNPFQAQSKSVDAATDALGTFFALLGSLFGGIVGFSVRKLAGKAHYLFPTLSFSFFNILMAPIMIA
eukprot:403354149